MTKPKVRREEVIWYPVAGPYMCVNCGHPHWGWQTRSGSFLGGMAPQWRWCDQEDCPCRSLRRASAVSIVGQPRAGVQPEGTDNLRDQASNDAVVKGHGLAPEGN